MRSTLNTLKEKFLSEYPSPEAEKAFEVLAQKLAEGGHKDTVTVRPFSCEGENPITGWSQPFKVFTYKRGYRDDLTHGHVTREEAKDMGEESGSFVIPIGMYEHSGIALYLDGSGGCPWDSSSFGVLYTNQEIWEECMGGTPLTRENIIKYCRSTINDTYTAYINGWVYGLEVIDEEGNNLDALHGMFYGDVDEEKIKDGLSEMCFDRDKYHVVIDSEIKY